MTRLLGLAVVLVGCASDPIVETDCEARVVLVGDVRFDSDTPLCEGELFSNRPMLTLELAGAPTVLVSFGVPDLAPGVAAELRADGLLVVDHRWSQAACSLTIASNVEVADDVWQLAGHASCGEMPMNDGGMVQILPFELRIPMSYGP